MATIDVIQEERLLENAVARGEQMRGHLERLQQRFPVHIAEIRGLGLMNALEFHGQVQRPGGARSQAGIAKELTKACLKRGLVLLKCSTFESVRFIPPLIITEQQMEDGMAIIKEAVEEVIRMYEQKA